MLFYLYQHATVGLEAVAEKAVEIIDSDSQGEEEISSVKDLLGLCHDTFAIIITLQLGVLIIYTFFLEPEIF